MGRFKELLENQEFVILHGALGTELEFRGHDVSGKLWSAKFLLENPQLIKGIHKDYIRAGADLVTTSTYQATFEGLAEAGLSQAEAEKLIRLTVDLAKEARDEVWADLSETEKTNRTYPLISGDVGPYAAYLANGSEYTGDYGNISLEELKDFHRLRMKLLLEQGAELLALETIPNVLETQALVELLADDFPNVEAYISFTSQDGQSISDGTSIEKIAELINSSEQVLAVGLNCTAPYLYPVFLSQLSEKTDKPLVTYPNSGEVYDGATQTWKEEADHSHSLLDNTLAWHKLGAKVVGGCCRTRPADIADLVAGLK
ncbi:homocysteine S-methyltransferase [Streptococcus suis]|uniref:homocysteine S-methyltransferase n=1 Tax=Streptococcus suis TaxID=1307 RepID=UPI000CF73563|nr:homocysteine S-methyltransferase [Streptococcus suis]MBO3756892.1 homocysteine S-methyltransferase [Streptococcus suis]